VLGSIVEGGAVCWDEELSVERCVGTDSCVWSDVLGTIVECGQ